MWEGVWRRVYGVGYVGGCMRRVVCGRVNGEGCIWEGVSLYGEGCVWEGVWVGLYVGACMGRVVCGRVYGEGCVGRVCGEGCMWEGV